MHQRHYSRKDVLFYGVLIPIICCFVAFTVTCAILGIYLMLGILFPVDILFIWIMLHTYYELEESFILIVSGPFRWKIKYGEIRGIVPSDGTTAGPALARSRWAILTTDGKRILISPQNETNFLEVLQDRIKLA